MARASAQAKKVQQTFWFNAPGASTVLLVADFTHWQKEPIPLRETPGGIWRTTVSLPPGQYRYRFVVDGEWRDDPDCKFTITNPFGTADAVVRVGVTGA